MNKRHNFTLVELLVVIGIIAILAGLILGAVTLSQSSARNTQAKADMAAIIMALRSVENTYGKFVNVKQIGSGSSVKTVGEFDGYTITALNTTDTGNFLYIGQAEKADHRTDDTYSEKAYDALIAELSVPKKLSTLNINKRKIVFLEPKTEFNAMAKYNYTLKTAKTDNDAATDPADDPDTQSKKQVELQNKRSLWRDPWGKRYTIIINVSGTKHIQLQEVADEPKSLGTNSFNIATDIAVYSHGPNGIDNGGCHADLETCINHDDRNNHKLHDDIASWRK